MRDKKNFASAILITTVMLFVGGCGWQVEPVSAEWAETIKEVDAEESLEPTPSPAALPEESMESPEAPGNSENEAIVEDEAIARDEVIVEDEAVAEDEVVTEDKVIVEDEAVVDDDAVVKDRVVVEEAVSANIESAKIESTKTAPTETAPAQTGSAPLEQQHEHNWAAHTNQRWVSKIVTVVDEPERYEEYTIFKIYWYNTGTWEETRDPDRFREWAYSEYGSLYPFYHIERMEDNPLFLGYNELGQPSFIGDHVLWGGYDFIPAVTHEEDQGYYETYVDYYYCDCGATK